MSHSACSITSFTWPGTSLLLYPPGNLPPLDHTLPWKTAQRPAHVGLSVLTSPWPFPPVCREHSAGLSTGCSGSRCAPATGPLSRYDTCTWGPSAKNISVRAEWLHQSGRGPSEPSETSRWRLTPHPALIRRVALYIALQLWCHRFFPLCRSPI